VKEDGLSTIVFDPTFSDSAKAVFAEAVKEHYYGHRLAAVRRIEKALEHLDFSPVEYAWLLVLRCLVDLRHQIRHVPKMLEHRRENHIRPEDKTMISAALWSYDILNETKEDEIEHHRVFDGKPTEHAARDMAACDLVIAAFQQHPIPLQGAAPLNDIQVSRCLWSNTSCSDSRALVDNELRFSCIYCTTFTFIDAVPTESKAPLALLKRRSASR
jgi:hypothetical protein